MLRPGEVRPLEYVEELLLDYTVGEDHSFEILVPEDPNVGRFEVWDEKNAEDGILEGWKRMAWARQG